jgi:DNA replication and repair protein RecF
MLIEELRVSNVRNIANANLTLDPKLNFIIGRNGAGKSSLLEALSLLSSGKSFRTRKIQSVISEQQDELLIFARCSFQSQPYTIGIARNRRGEYRAKINGEPCHKLSEISRLLPIFVIAPGFYDDIANNRAGRLRLLDWGLFHVEHEFYGVWREFQQLLKQRNALLKQIKYKQIAATQLDYWDELFCERAENVTRLRQNYIARLSDTFAQGHKRYDEFQEAIQLGYATGLSAKYACLIDALRHQREYDIQKGITQSGPHRADLKLLKNKQPVMETASRGQQKIIVNRLMITLIEHYIKATQKGCLVALDDLASELDADNQNRLLQSLIGLEGAQLLVTSITQDSLPKAISGYNGHMFHVEHGRFQVH